ncbi:MAG: hypothetical protein ACTHJT_06205 [Cytophaga sp.]|uniref:hypothetical protein n=1 Tax=Cytophaga sp. TaxID=29535 RepID=UPI003F807F60
MQNSYIKFILLLVIVSAMHFSCKREFEKPRWNTQVIAPLVKSRLTIRDIVTDSSQVETESDNSITLVNRQKIFDYSIDSLVALNAPPYKKTVKLSSLVLSDQEITQRISLGTIAKQLIAQGNPLGAQIILAGKLGIPLAFPGANDITAGPINVDISKFFVSANLLTGQMIVSVSNGLPLTIDNLTFSLNNITPPGLITTQTFTNIVPGATQSKTQDLAGKTIGGNINANIDDMDIGSGVIVVDTSDALLLTLKVQNISVTEATAIFPAQDVVNETTDVELTGLENVRLTSTIIRQGTVRADVYSTADDTVRFTYEIPAATNENGIFKFEAVVPPAPPNGTSYAQFNSDFSGYLLDLTGQDGTKYNTFYNTLVGRINYTGRLVTLSLNDSLDITLTLLDAKPSYVKGYLGQDTIEVGPGTVDFDVFKNISASSLQFQSAKLDIVFENALGIPAKAVLNELTAYNTSTGTSVALSGTPINKEYPIAPAIEGVGVSIPVNSTLDLSTGSNVTSLLNILPDKITYKGLFDSNPQVSLPPYDTTYTDFAYAGADMKAYLDMRIPLTLIASNLVLSDTSDFDINTLQTGGYQDGKFNLLVSNGFPLDLKVDMRFLDKNGHQIDSIITTSTILAAPVDNTTGKVIAPKASAVPFTLSAAEANILIQQGAKLVFTARFDTKPANQNITIYDDYAIEFKLVGDIGILVNSGK